MAIKRGKRPYESLLINGFHLFPMEVIIISNETILIIEFKSQVIHSFDRLQNKALNDFWFIYSRKTIYDITGVYCKINQNIIL